jgi:diguanylate cyclase (GGDEF)-like protein
MHGIQVLQLSLGLLIVQVYALGTVLAEKQRVQNALAQAYRNMEQLAGLDPLTQLSNRRSFDVRLHAERERCIRDQTCLTVLIIDVDDFKSYNDRFGHPTGDALLKAVSNALRKAAHRATDLAPRFGGEEFAIVLPNTDSAAAYLVAEHLRETIGAMRISDDNGELPQITISIGVATSWPLPNGDPNQLMHGADHALYMAKNSGRNKIWVWIEESEP